MKQLKKDLIKEVEELEGKLENISGREEARRAELSQFLGSPVTRHFGGMYEEHKTLSWAEIFFQLGKVMSETHTIEMVDTMRGNIGDLQKTVGDILKERMEGVKHE
jgi:tetrahydromethanopterin S-methyltransferase subunit G